MTKTILAAVMALSLASGAAMAQEADAQNWFDAGKRAGALQVAPSGQVGSYSVQHQQLTADPQLSAAGGGGN